MLVPVHAVACIKWREQIQRENGRGVFKMEGGTISFTNYGFLIKLRLNCKSFYSTKSVKYFDIKIDADLKSKQFIHNTTIKPEIMLAYSFLGPFTLAYIMQI